MKQNYPSVYGIGNPLMDIIVAVQDQDLADLGVQKGAMTLTDGERHKRLIAFAESHKPSYSPGGSCPNTICTLAAMGVDATLSGCVGEDTTGAIYQSRLNDMGVQNSLVRSTKAQTGASVIMVTPDSERSMNTYLGANRQFSPEDVDAEALSRCGFFHFTGYMWDTENQKAAIRGALEVCRQHGVMVSFDVADMMAVQRYKDQFFDLISHSCDIVYANHEEAALLFDDPDPESCCKKLSKLVKIAVVKNGKRGSFVMEGGKLYKIPALGSIHPVDTTGAGDTYAAGFLYGMVRGLGVEKAGEIASFLAGEIITGWGAQFTPEKARRLKDMLEKGTWLVS